MSLEWAWAFSLGSTFQQALDSGWAYHVGGTVDPGATTTPCPRQPAVGYGGFAVGLSIAWNGAFVSQEFPNGALHDGEIQFHLYLSPQCDTTPRIRLISATGVCLLELRPAVAPNAVGITRFEVWSGEGAGALALRGTMTTSFNAFTWHTIGIRLHCGGANGDISVSVDGVQEDIVVNGAVGATSSWGRIGFERLYAESRVGCITVWNSAADTALTATWWASSLRPDADHDTTDWTSTAGNFWSVLDDATINTADYAQTIIGAAEILLLVSTSAIDAAWAPDSIAGVSVVGSMRGALGLIQASPITHDTVTAEVDYGTMFGPLDGETSQAVNSVFLLDAHGDAWSVASIDDHAFGVAMT